MVTSSRQIVSTAALAVVGGLALRSVVRRIRRYSFGGKVVWITGGSRGLGLVMARQLACEQARIAICARDAAELSRAEDELRRAGADVFAAPCDVTRRDQVESFVQQVRQSLGPVDVLINNAGIITVGPVETMTLQDYEQAMAAHFWAPLYAIHAVLPDMKARQRGRIVNISSIGGKISVPHLVPYSASKFALVGLSQGLCSELAKDGIRVTTVCPGLMRTGSPRHAKFKGQHRAEYTWFSISDSIPLLSIRAERAAGKILNACRYGRAELIVSLPAKIAISTNVLAPELTTDALAAINRLLPGPGGIGERTRKGSHSASKYSPSWITTLTEQAALRNNEISPAERM